MKEKWRDRAKSLNDRPRNDGILEELPLSLVVDKTLEKEVKVSITMEWRHIVATFKNAITRKVINLEESEKSYVFGPERVQLQSQCYRSFFLSHIIQIIIFGKPLFSLIHCYELVHRSKKEVIVHFASHSRASQLFTIGGLCAFEFMNNNASKWIGCGKVALLNSEKKELIGYVLDECREKINILMNNGKCISMKRPEFNIELGKYVFGHCESLIDQDNTDSYSDEFTIIQYWPIRLKVNISSGRSSFTLNRIIIQDDINNKNTCKIVQLH